MVMKSGERWRCTHPACRCAVLVENTGEIEGQSPRCACGSVIDLPREPKLANRIDVFGGVCSEESAALLRHFFETRR